MFKILFSPLPNSVCYSVLQQICQTKKNLPYAIFGFRFNPECAKVDTFVHSRTVFKPKKVKFLYASIILDSAE